MEDILVYKKVIYDKNKSIEVEKGYIVDNYISKDDDIGYSVVRTHLDGKHPFMKNTNSNRTYYIINGEAKFYIDDQIINLIDWYFTSIKDKWIYLFFRCIMQTYTVAVILIIISSLIEE